MSNAKIALTNLLSLMLLLGLGEVVSAQTSASAVAGFNLSAAPSGPPIQVDWNLPMEAWMLQVDLVFDPDAGPMQKLFETPKGASGGPIQLDALQPLPQTLWEDFLILPIPGSSTGYAVSDWHEEIHTPGWEWVLPGDPRFPTLFPPNESLITRDGVPWPWDPIPMPTMDPSKLWVKFPPIEPGHVLDVHKALLWAGTPGNRIWGDGTDDAGNLVDESVIDVWEYPTPEPTTISLLGMAALAVLVRRQESARCSR